MRAFLLVGLLACPAMAMPEHAPERAVLAMGTRLTLRLEDGSEAGLSKVAEAMLAEVARIEGATSTWRSDSPWSRLNAAKGEVRSLDPEWIQLLTRAQAWSRETEGAFDPVLGALLRAWGVREGGRRPSAEELTRARTASGVSHLRLDSQVGTAQLLHPEASLEEGAFLKGYALDAARRVAEARGAAIGQLDFGGQLLAWGRAVEVEVAHPRDRQRAAVRLRLVNASLSTSGCSERGGHLLDPRSGEPCLNWGAVSVVSPSALNGDLLSTALYVLGPDHGLAWAEARGLAALFLPNHGPARMTAAFRMLNPTFLIQEIP